MAKQARIVCTTHGCPNLQPCPTHHRKADDHRPNAAARGYDARWQAERRRYLASHPRCQWPGCTHPATDVDHEDGLGPLGPQGYDWANLRAYCHPHHSAKTATYDGGFGNPPKPKPNPSSPAAAGHPVGGYHPPAEHPGTVVSGV